MSVQTNVVDALLDLGPQAITQRPPPRGLCPELADDDLGRRTESDHAGRVLGSRASPSLLPHARAGLAAAAPARLPPHDTILVCLMLANNEIGTIEPVAAVAAVCRERGVLSFTDAVQALGKIPVDVKALGVDLAAFSAHKIGGPKGTGALYVRRGVKLAPHTHGGGQARGRRSGTENPAGIVGFGVGAELVAHELETQAPRWRELRGRLWDAMRSRIDDVRLNGHPTDRVPHNLNVSIKGVVGEDILLMLDAEGICASTGSACSTGSLEPSHVLLAIGRDRDEALSALRLSFGDACRGLDVDALVDTIVRLAVRRRSIVPKRLYQYAYSAERKSA